MLNIGENIRKMFKYISIATEHVIVKMCLIECGMSQNCAICSWINELVESPFLIKEMETGYAVLSKYSFNKGYVLFLYKKHLTELHQIPIEERQKFLIEMSQVAEATLKATKADKMNYELLGNAEPHLHWHLIPRYKTEKNPKMPIWVIDKQIRQGNEYSADSKEVKVFREKIFENLV